MKPPTLLLASALLSILGMDHDAPKLAGVRLEMTKDQVKKVLGRDAVFKSEDENQQVWIFSHDPSMRSVIVGFAPDNRVRYVTVLARTDGTPFMKCVPLSDPRKAQMTGQAPDAIYTHTWKEHEESFVATARGIPDHFTSCSVKKIGVGMEDEEQEQRERHKAKS